MIIVGSTRFAAVRVSALSLPALALATFVGCRTPTEFTTPIPIDDTFPRREGTAEEMKRWDEAAAWSEDRGGLALMVLRGTDVVYERYADGYSGETPIHLYSGTKSFSCGLLQGLRDQGLALDSRVGDEISEWDGNDRKATIEIADLLHFTSGLKQDQKILTVDALYEEQRVDDKYAYAINLPALQAPGEKFEYGSTHLAVFGAYIDRRFGDPVDLIEELVLDPIGLRTAGWIRDPVGQPMLAFGAWTTANEWAKFGVLARDDGIWQGQQILPSGGFTECFQGSAANPAYGLTFWLNEPVGQGVEVPGFGDTTGSTLLGDRAPDDFVMAAGAFDQRLYIVPSQNLVVVRLGTGNARFKDLELTEMVLDPVGK